MNEHPLHKFEETYIAERLMEGGAWLEVQRFSHLGNAVEYVRNNSPMFSPWRIVRLRTEVRSEVMQQQKGAPAGEAATS